MVVGGSVVVVGESVVVVVGWVVVVVDDVVVDVLDVLVLVLVEVEDVEDVVGTEVAVVGVPPVVGGVVAIELEVVGGGRLGNPTPVEGGVGRKGGPRVVVEENNPVTGSAAGPVVATTPSWPV